MYTILYNYNVYSPAKETNIIWSQQLSNKVIAVLAMNKQKFDTEKETTNIFVLDHRTVHCMLNRKHFSVLH